MSLADDAARKAGDGALNRLTVSVALTAGHRVGHHKVDGILCGTADLEDTESGGSVNVQASCECTFASAYSLVLLTGWIQLDQIYK